MNLEEITTRHRQGGFNVRETLREDKEWVACFGCQKIHELKASNKDQDYQDFAARHPTERGCLVLRLGPQQMERACRRAERKRKRLGLSIANFTHNANVLEAFAGGGGTTMDLTSFNSLASSATAGWSSQYINNGGSLYLDYLAEFVLANVNTAASGNSAFYVYSCGTTNISNLPTNTAGNTVANSSSTAAALTFNTIVSNPTGFVLIKAIPYVTTNKMPNVGAFPCAQAYNGWLPQYIWWPFVNYAGPTIAASSNTFTVLGVFNTVS